MWALALLGLWGRVSATQLTIRTHAPAAGQFLVQPGERAVVQGDARGALEVWIYPFEIVRGYRIERIGRGGERTPLSALSLRTAVHPDAIDRIYSGREFTLTEHWFVPRDRPGVVLSYRLRGRRSLTLRVRFHPVLNLMWPGAIGGQSGAWVPTLHAFVIREPSGRYRGYVGSPQARQHSPAVAGAPLGFTLHLTPAHPRADVVMSLGLRGQYDGKAVYRYLRHAWRALQRRDRRMLRSQLGRLTRLRTPDPAANRAFRWAEIALLKAWVCNPELGCALVAGYGPTRPGRRPQYDWFFGGDGLIAARALEAVGDRPRVRAEFAFLRRYQNARTGMMWHELSQSAGLIDWSRYPYEYLHPDISMDYLTAAAEVWRTSRDRRWLRAAWPSLEAAYRYIGTLREPVTGIPLIPRGERGQNEQLSLREELSLSLDMLSAEKGYAALAQAMGRVDAARGASVRARALQAVIGPRYWNAKDGFVVQGFLRDGRPTAQQRPPVGALQSPAFSPAQQDALIKRLLRPDFLTPWGLRSLPTTDAAYDPDRYASGSVWPVENAAFATALWAHHRDAPALHIWNVLVAATTMGTPGHIAEVFSGSAFRALDVAVPAQTWSSAGFLLATVRGLFGYRPDAPANLLRLAPHLPAGWSRMSVRRLPFGKDPVDVDVERTPGRMGVRWSMKRPLPGVRWVVSLPAACAGASLRAKVDGRPVTPDTTSAGGHVEAIVRGEMGDARSARAVIACVRAR